MQIIRELIQPFLFIIGFVMTIVIFGTLMGKVIEFFQRIGPYLEKLGTTTSKHKK